MNYISLHLILLDLKYDKKKAEIGKGKNLILTQTSFSLLQSICLIHENPKLCPWLESDAMLHYFFLKVKISNLVIQGYLQAKVLSINRAAASEILSIGYICLKVLHIIQ